jgi:UDP-glucose 4-epimerase
VAERIALVTGARGFLGRHVARLLSDQGYAVHGLGHGDCPPEEWGRLGLASWTAGEVNLESLVGQPQPELIVHCAGGASVASSVEQPLRDYRRSVESTVAVLEYVRLRAPHAAVLLPSSGSVYGSHESGAVAENAALSPQSPYAVHKLLAEQRCAEYGKSFGVRSAVLRFFSVYGSGLRKQLLWEACNRLSRGEASFSGTGGETRDWLHVEDAVQLILKAAGHASPSSPIVNGGCGVGATVREVVTELARALGFAGQVTFTQKQRPGDPFRVVADNRLALSWGWAPRIPWRAGVHEYAAWFAGGGQ